MSSDLTALLFCWRENQVIALLEALLCGNQTAARSSWIGDMPGIRGYPLQVPAGRVCTAVPAPGQLEILFCQQGSLLVEFKHGRQLRIEAGDVLFVSGSAEIRFFRPVRRMMRGILVTVELQQSLERLWATSGLHLDLKAVEEHLAAHEGCVSMGATAWTQAVFSALDRLDSDECCRYCIFKAAELLYLLSSSSVLLPPRTPAAYYDAAQTSAVKQARDYLMAHPEVRITIPQLSRRYNLSATLFKACFRQLFGKPVHQWLMEYRLARAARLLSDSMLPVSQIAQMVGYNSPSQFGVAFKRVYHMAPVRFRQENRKKNVCSGESSSD